MRSTAERDRRQLDELVLRLKGHRRRGVVLFDPAGNPMVLPLTGDAGDVLTGDGTFVTPPASGDVFGPASATDDRIATFDGGTGKLIQDGGQTIAEVIAAAAAGAGDVVGPASNAADGGVPLFDGTTGKLLKDSGATIASIVASAVIQSGDVFGPASAVADRVAVYDGTTGKLIKDGGKTIATIISDAGDVDGPGSATSGNLASYNGTTGKIIQDSGLSAALLSALLGAEVGIAEVNLTEAALEAIVLNDQSTYPTIVSAPGSGRVVVPICLFSETIVTVGYTNAPLGFLVYGAADIDSTSFDTINWTPYISTATGTKYAYGVAVSGGVEWGPTVTAPTNLPVKMGLSAALTGSGSGTMKVRLLYYIADFN